MLREPTSVEIMLNPLPSMFTIQFVGERVRLIKGGETVITVNQVNQVIENIKKAIELKKKDAIIRWKEKKYDGSTHRMCVLIKSQNRLPNPTPEAGTGEEGPAITTFTTVDGREESNPLAMAVAKTST